MTHPVLLTIAMPRSGTSFCFHLAKIYFSDKARIEHEPIGSRAAKFRHFFRCFDPESQERALQDPVISDFVTGVQRSAETKPVMIFGNTLSHLAPILASIFGDRLRILHLHRHPVINTAALYVHTEQHNWRNIPPYDEEPWGKILTPFDPNTVFQHYCERWEKTSIFERMLYHWLEVTSYAAECHRTFCDIPYLELSADTLFKDDNAVMRIFDLMGLERPGLPLNRAESPKNATWQRTIEETPLGASWRAYEHHRDVIATGQRLGYTFDSVKLETILAKYQVPQRVFPLLRHHLRWWQIRRHVAEFLRAKHLLPPATYQQGLQPRTSGRIYSEWVHHIKSRLKGNTTDTGSD